MEEAYPVGVKRVPRMRSSSSLVLNLHEHDVCKEGPFAS